MLYRGHLQQHVNLAEETELARLESGAEPGVPSMMESMGDVEAGTALDGASEIASQPMTVSDQSIDQMAISSIRAATLQLVVGVGIEAPEDGMETAIRLGPYSGAMERSSDSSHDVGAFLSRRAPGSPL